MRTPTGTFLRVGLTGVVSLALVAGCSDDPKPGTLNTPSATPTSTTASPTPTTPEAQIEATMRAYFEATNDAIKSGDVTELKSFSSSGCPCRRVVKSITKTARTGGRFEGLRYDVQSIKVHDVEGNTGLAEVLAKLPPYKVFDGDGAVTEDSPGGKLHTDFSLVRSGDRWIIGNALNLE